MRRKIFSLVLIALFLYIIFPLVLPIVLGGIFAILFFPALTWLESRKVKISLASLLLTLGITLLILLPISTMVFVAAKTALSQVRVWREMPRPPGDSVVMAFLHSARVHTLLDGIERWIPMKSDEMVGAGEDLARAAGIKLADLLGTLLGLLPGVAVGLAVMILSIFFFLRDGRSMVAFIRENSLVTKTETERLIVSLSSMCRSVVLAVVSSAAMQAVLFGVACLVCRVPNTPLIAFLVFLAAFVPLIGATPITFGVAIYYLMSGETAVGVSLLIVAIGALVGDSILRPIILQDSGNLHPLLGFVSVLGGLQVFGFTGIFLGPILAGLFVVTIQNLIQDNPA